MIRKKVYVIVLNWNGKKDSISCLDSLRCLDVGDAIDYVVVVCDNESSDGSSDAIREWALSASDVIDVPEHIRTYLPRMVPRAVNFAEFDRETAEAGGHSDNADVVLIHTGANLGYAGGNNVGIRYALARGDADFVWVLNNDTFVHPDSLATLVERCMKDDDIAMVGSTLRYFDEPEKIQARGGCSFIPWRVRARPIGEGAFCSSTDGESHAEIEKRTAYVVGASLLVPRAFLEAVGLMQEDYFLYFEELDWAERARRDSSRRWRLGYADKSIVFHKVGASAGTNERSAFSLRLLYGNQLRFMRRFYPHFLVVARLMLFVEAAKAFVKGKFTEAKVFSALIFASSVSPVRR
ncbi:glycosyltransferase family 2 protein [Methyloversatilis sp.]|uniref:glycosyltransferase family 2 protein n=1 Tax=Methyloversatilis sp. TaxID=2569862 RepID=UPI0027328C49|nr:glycosyltransferase family 2 protein [Methyloversatilis sp.]MDP3455945.1 glycosyltransferase family 2 protein [Methyloversatilis sp.]